MIQIKISEGEVEFQRASPVPVPLWPRTAQLAGPKRDWAKYVLDQKGKASAFSLIPRGYI